MCINAQRNIKNTLIQVNIKATLYTTGQKFGLIQSVSIKLIKNDSKAIYDVSKDYHFK